MCNVAAHTKFTLEVKWNTCTEVPQYYVVVVFFTEDSGYFTFVLFGYSNIAEIIQDTAVLVGEKLQTFNENVFELQTMHFSRGVIWGTGNSFGEAAGGRISGTGDNYGDARTIWEAIEVAVQVLGIVLERQNGSELRLWGYT